MAPKTHDNYLTGELCFRTPLNRLTLTTSWSSSLMEPPMNGDGVNKRYHGLTFLNPKLDLHLAQFVLISSDFVLNLQSLEQMLFSQCHWLCAKLELWWRRFLFTRSNVTTHHHDLLLCYIQRVYWKFTYLQHIANLAGNKTVVLPVPAFNVINGGSHAGNKLAMQVTLLEKCDFLNACFNYILWTLNCCTGVHDPPNWCLLIQGGHEDGSWGVSQPEGEQLMHLLTYSKSGPLE